MEESKVFQFPPAKYKKVFKKMSLPFWIIIIFFAEVMATQDSQKLSWKFS